MEDVTEREETAGDVKEVAGYYVNYTDFFCKTCMEQKDVLIPAIEREDSVTLSATTYAQLLKDEGDDVVCKNCGKEILRAFKQAMRQDDLE